MAKASKRAIAEMNSLESSIMDTRRRIDQRTAEIERRVLGALSARYLLSRYSTPLAIACFGLGFFIGLGAFKPRRFGKRHAEGGPAFTSALIAKIAAPVVTELLLRRIKKFDR